MTILLTTVQKQTWMKKQTDYNNYMIQTKVEQYYNF